MEELLGYINLHKSSWLKFGKSTLLRTTKKEEVGKKKILRKDAMEAATLGYTYTTCIGLVSLFLSFLQCLNLRRPKRKSKEKK